MFAFLKAALLGAFLTVVVSLFVGSAGSTGGLLNVRLAGAGQIHLYWSWTLFVAGTGLALAILLLMD